MDKKRDEILKKIGAPVFDIEASDDPEVQGLLSSFAWDAMRQAGRYPQAKLSELAEIDELVRKDDAWSRRVILASLVQFEYLDRLGLAYKSTGRSKTDQDADFERVTNYQRFGNMRAREAVSALVAQLLRRRLKLDDADEEEAACGVAGASVEPSAGSWQASRMGHGCSRGRRCTFRSRSHFERTRRALGRAKQAR